MEKEEQHAMGSSDQVESFLSSIKQVPNCLAHVGTRQMKQQLCEI
jgi:hypothetical protein